LIEKEVQNEIYNISGNESFKNIEVVKKVLDLYFVGEKYNLEDYVDLSLKRIGQDKRYALNDNKIRNLS